MSPPRLVRHRRVRPAGRLAHDRRGTTAVEYGLIAAVIVIVMLASFKLVAALTVGTWGNVHTQVVNASSS